MANEREISFQKEMAKLRSAFHDRLIAELEDFVAYAGLTDQEMCRTATLKQLYEERRQIAAMMTGGDDFIVNPVVEESFVATITGRAQRARQLAELMTRDSLTGLLKHPEIKERLGHEYARAGRNKSVLSVAMPDIDKFKRVNDNYEHQTGDVVIATLAHLLHRGLRTTDILGRYGGEEYLVVMPDTDAKNAAIKLNSLRTEFQAVTFRHNDEVFTCSVSGGICQSDQVEGLDEFVEQADKALYRAKERGRNQIVQADDTN